MHNALRKLDHCTTLEWLTIVLGVTVAALVVVAFISRPAKAETYFSRCSLSHHSASCFAGSFDAGPRIIHLPRDNSPEAAERERAWEAFCKPVPVVDSLGVSRNVYAHPGCEFGRTK